MVNNQPPSDQENKRKETIVSNISKLDPEHPIPFEKKGLTFMAERQYKYLPFLGNEDNFFETLAEARALSPTQNACISTKVKYSLGTGWTFNDANVDKEFKKVFAKVVNKKGESLNEIIKKIFDNLYTSGNVFINLVKTTAGKTTKIRIFVKNNFDSRFAYSDDHDCVTEVVFSSQFRKESGYMTLTSDQVEIPLYTGDIKQKWRKLKNGDEHVCIHIKNEVATCDHYGLPSNHAVLLNAQLEYKAARYNIDNFDNNLVLGGILMLKSSMSETEAKKHGKKIVDTHSGDGKRGRVMIMASEEGFEDTKWIPFDKAEEGSFIEMDKRQEEKIIVGNEWDAVLAGLNTGSSLGHGKGYFKEIFEVKMKTVIRPEQEKIIEKFLQPLLEIIDTYCELPTKYADLPIDIETPMPVSYGTDIDPDSVLTVDEGRAIIGKEPLEDKEMGKQLISKNSNSKTNQNVPDKPTK